MLGDNAPDLADDDTVRIGMNLDRTADRGSYWEPNVWLIHPDIEA